MKIYFLLFGALPFALHSQLTLTQQSHEPKMGTSTNYCNMNDSTSGIPRSSGVGQTWDFSGFVATKYCFPITYSTAIPNGANAQLMSNSGFYLSSSNPASWSYTGYTDGSYGSVVYNNPKTLMEWPFTFASTFSDNFSASGSIKKAGITESITESGNITVTGTGTGTLITPLGQIFTNVLQITSTQTSSTSHQISGGSSFSFATLDTITERSYYIVNRVLPIVIERSHKSATLPSTFPISYSLAPTVQFASDLTTVPLEPILRRRETVAFPSPCDKSLNLQVGDGENLQDLRIFDSRGVLLQAINVQSAKGNYEITTESFAPGVYVILIESTLGRTSKKFIVAR